MESDRSSPQPVAPAFDRRLYPRYRWSMPVTVYGANRLPVKGISIEISASGMSAVMSAALEIGESVNIEPVGGGRVLATAKRRLGRVYSFEFLNLAPASLRTIIEACGTLPIFRPRHLDF